MTRRRALPGTRPASWCWSARRSGPSGGDLIGLFLHETVPSGLSPTEAIAAVRAQGGLVGMPHPFDRFRGSLGRGDATRIEELAGSVDWIETWNARLLIGDGNAHAAELAARVGTPGVAVSDAHTTMEVGIAATILSGDPGTADGLRAALAGPLELVTGRASAYVRLIGPAAKLVQRARGRGRARGAVADPMTDPGAPVDPAEEPAPAADADEVTADQLSLARRLRQPRTIISIVLPIVLLALFVKSLPGFKLEELPDKILGANPLLLFASFAIFYVGFPLRGLRWAMLVRRTGFPLKIRDATEIIFLSWLVNCLVPAKLGDVYRAYLLKINSTGLAVAHVRDGVHRTRPGPVRDRGPRPGGRLRLASGAACRPTSRSCSRSGSCSCSHSPAAC